MEQNSHHNCKMTEICIASTCDHNKVHCNECKTQAHKLHGKYVISTQLFKQKLIEYRDSEFQQLIISNVTDNLALIQKQKSQPSSVQLLSQIGQLKKSVVSTVQQLEHLIYSSVPDLQLVNKISDMDQWNLNDWKKCLQIFNLNVDKKQIKQGRNLDLNFSDSSLFTKNFIEQLNQLQDLQEQTLQKMGSILSAVQNQGFSQHLKRKIDHSKIAEDNSHKIFKKIKLNGHTNNDSLPIKSDTPQQNKQINNNDTNDVKLNTSTINNSEQNSTSKASNINLNLRVKQPVNYNPPENESFITPSNTQYLNKNSEIQKKFNIDESSSDFDVQTQPHSSQPQPQGQPQGQPQLKKSSAKTQPQKNFSEEQKISILREALQNFNINKTAEKYEISRGVVVVWKKTYGNFPQLRQLNVSFEKSNKFIPNCHKKSPKELLEKSFESIFSDSDNSDRLRLLTILKSVADHEGISFPSLKKVDQYLPEYLDYYSQIMKQQEAQNLQVKQDQPISQNQNNYINIQMPQSNDLIINSNNQNILPVNSKQNSEHSLNQSQKLNQDKNQQEDILQDEEKLELEKKQAQLKFDQDYNENLKRKILKKRENASNVTGMQNVIQLPILNQGDLNYLCGVDSEPYLFIGSNGKMIKIFKKPKGLNQLKSIQDLQYDNSVIIQIKKFYFNNCYYLFILREDSNINIWNLSKKKMIIDQFKLSKNPSDFPVLDVEIIDQKSEFFQIDENNPNNFPIMFVQSDNGEITKFEIQIQNDPSTNQNQDKISSIKVIKLQEQFHNKIFRCLKNFQIYKNQQFEQIEKQLDVLAFVFQNKIVIIDQDGEILQEIQIKEQSQQTQIRLKIEEKSNEIEQEGQNQENNTQNLTISDISQNIIDINGFEFNYQNQNFVITKDNGFLYLYAMQPNNDGNQQNYKLNFTKTKVKYPQKSQSSQNNISNGSQNQNQTQNSLKQNEENKIVGIRKFWLNSKECNILVIYPNSCSLQKFNEDIHSYKRLNFPSQNHKIGYNSIGMIVNEEQNIDFKNLSIKDDSENKENLNSEKQQQNKLQFALVYSIHPNEMRLFIK